MNAPNRQFSWILVFATIAIAASWAHHGRADAPAGRYTMSNGVVTDTKTMLDWEQASAETMRTWTDANAYCTNLGTKWRLPSMKELQTLVDRKRLSPALDTKFFPIADMMPTVFWTSSERKGTADNVWTIDFSTGFTDTSAKTDTRRVRCVR